tara:strand:+ start:980 stop:2314 length:1335 start_codon:yes stop_codon:yes gene_type:complete
MKKLIILIMILFASTIVKAQVQTIKGTVKLTKPKESKTGDKILTINRSGVVTKSTVDVTGISSGSTFKVTGTGLPPSASTDDVYREGMVGIGEPVPAELLDVVGTSTTGGFKVDYTYADGGVTRVQVGENILSEIGVSGRTQGWMLDYFDNSVSMTEPMRGYIYAGDLTGAGVDNFTAGFGLADLTSTRFSRLVFNPAAEGNDTNWWGRFQSSNVAGDFSELVTRTNGVGIGHGLESQLDLYVNNVETDNSRLYITPHWFRFNNGNINLGNLWGINTYTEGYLIGDTMAKTGTAETTIGAPAFNVVVDADGTMSTTSIVYKTIKVSLTASEIINLSTTPIVAIAAPGVGKVIVVTNAVYKYNFGTVAFDNNGINVRLIGGNQYVESGAIINGVVDKIVVGNVITGLTAFTVLENTGIDILATADSVATGDGTLDVIISYSEITL